MHVYIYTCTCYMLTKLMIVYMYSIVLYVRTFSRYNIIHEHVHTLTVRYMLTNIFHVNLNFYICSCTVITTTQRVAIFSVSYWHYHWMDVMPAYDSEMEWGQTQGRSPPPPPRPPSSPSWCRVEAGRTVEGAAGEE